VVGHNIPCMGLNYDLIIAPDTRSFKLKRWPEGQGINPPKYWKLKGVNIFFIIPYFINKKTNT
ncbi:hypothetical protein KJ641_01890, partial [Patescibacteria group bacterium]|nr:hypothetical protein [Patescibacteria group bacterium]